MKKTTVKKLPVHVYKEISGDHDLKDLLKDLNITTRPVLSLYDEETKIQTLGTREVFVFNPATEEEEAVIQFIIVDRDLTPLIGLNDSETPKCIELLGDNITFVAPAKPSVPATAWSADTTHHGNHLSNYADVFNDSIGKLEGELHLYTRDDVLPHKTAPREVPLSVKNNVIAEVKYLQEQGILENITEPSEWVSVPTNVNKPSAKNAEGYMLYRQHVLYAV